MYTTAASSYAHRSHKSSALVCSDRAMAAPSDCTIALSLDDAEEEVEDHSPRARCTRAFIENVKSMRVYRDPQVQRPVIAVVLDATPFPLVVSQLVYSYLLPIDFVLKCTSKRQLVWSGELNLYQPTHAAQTRAKDEEDKEVHILHLPIEYAPISKVLSVALDANVYEYPLSFRPEVVERMCDFVVHHQGKDIAIIEAPLTSTIMRDVCQDPWDADFIDYVSENRQVFYDLQLLANYLDIKGLLHLACMKLAALIKGLPLEQIQEVLSKGIQKKESDPGHDIPAT